MVDSVRKLARKMRDRHDAGDPPFTLFLGIAALLAPGSLDSEITRFFNRSVPDEHLMTSDAERIEAYFAYLDDADRSKRAEILKWLLNAAAPSAGYRHLANLVVNGYFRVLISSGFDTFIEQSLYDAGLWSRDLRIYCLSRDDVPKKGIAKEAVHLVKLHGDPYAKDFWDTWMDLKCSPETVSLVSRAMAGDLIMVGYHPRDGLINPLLERQGGELVYVNAEEPGSEFPLPEAVEQRMRMAISGKYGTLDTFFGTLADLLLYRPVSVNVQQSGDTVSPGGSVIGVNISKIGDSNIVTQLDENIDLGNISGEIVGGSEMLDPDAELLESLRSQLSALQGNYYKVQKQAAMYGTGNAPTSLKNQLQTIEGEMGKLKAEIDVLENKEA